MEGKQLVTDAFMGETLDVSAVESVVIALWAG